MPEVDPDQLLKELDAKLALMRANRSRASGKNTTLKIGVIAMFGIILILVLWVLQLFLSEMTPRPKSPAPVPGSVQDRK